MYIGIKTWENGNRIEEAFEEYSALCAWLAESPEAGIAAYCGDAPVDQIQLQDDVAATL